MMLLALPGCTLHCTYTYFHCSAAAALPGPLQQLQQCWHQAFKAALYCDCAGRAAISHWTTFGKDAL